MDKFKYFQKLACMGYPEHPPQMVHCPACKGSGQDENSPRTSDCCGAGAFSNGDSSTEDYGICPDCRDHCEYVHGECELCGGTGRISEEELRTYNEEKHFSMMEDEDQQKRMEREHDNKQDT